MRYGMLRTWPIAWQASLHRVGWWPVVGCSLVVALLLALTQMVWKGSNGVVTAVRIPETIIPLFAGMHAAFLLSPEDEESLELLLAAPRPIAWLLLERLAILLGFYAAVGLTATLAAALLPHTGPFGQMLWRWLAPTLWFVGIAIFITLFTRQGMLGLLLVLMMWGSLLTGGDGIIESCPLLRPIHPFLQPDSLTTTPAIYAYNRGTLSLLGLSLLAIAIGRANDEERMLGIRGFSITELQTINRKSKIRNRKSKR